MTHSRHRVILQPELVIAADAHESILWPTFNPRVNIGKCSSPRTVLPSASSRKTTSTTSCDRSRSRSCSLELAPWEIPGKNRRNVWWGIAGSPYTISAMFSLMWMSNLTAMGWHMSQGAYSGLAVHTTGRSPSPPPSTSYSRSSRRTDIWTMKCYRNCVR
ncbi:hypothetical protein FIBSPDRAFT_869596 [Athelia psychrophila]|uniref:Uncharacterized protein n=1 Tax=Athelia psychrophila TaxID=1759441 RepID=A0A166C032_9AGAM|nr:hypothetical protein FIBSPDRAFT_869596 [Fibularhizoctonia sp. CBS 109695]